MPVSSSSPVGALDHRGVGRARSRRVDRLPDANAARSASIAVRLATSPPRCPPMPSAIAYSTCSSSTRNESSLLPRTARCRWPSPSRASSVDLEHGLADLHAVALRRTRVGSCDLLAVHERAVASSRGPRPTAFRRGRTRARAPARRTCRTRAARCSRRRGRACLAVDRERVRRLRRRAPRRRAATACGRACAAGAGARRGARPGAARRAPACPRSSRATIQTTRARKR